MRRALTPAGDVPVPCSYKSLIAKNSRTSRLAQLTQWMREGAQGAHSGGCVFFDECHRSAL